MRSLLSLLHGHPFLHSDALLETGTKQERAGQFRGGRQGRSLEGHGLTTVQEFDSL